MLHCGRFALCGDWDDTPTPARALRLVLVPSLIHSNGWSPWTQAGLAAVEASIEPGMTVADIGTGTGILAIAAVLLGAAQVTALDLHPEACAVARQNVAVNGLTEQITVLEGSVPSHPVDLAIVSISTAWWYEHRDEVDADCVLVVHDDASWEKI